MEYMNWRSTISSTTMEGITWFVNVSVSITQTTFVDSKISARQQLLDNN